MPPVFSFFLFGILLTLLWLEYGTLENILNALFIYLQIFFLEIADVIITVFVFLLTVVRFAYVLLLAPAKIEIKNVSVKEDGTS